MTKKTAPQKESLAGAGKNYPPKKLLEEFTKTGKPVVILEEATFVKQQNAKPSKYDKLGEKMNYLFEKDGEQHLLYNCGHLQHQVDKLKAGDVVDVTYLGQEELPAGHEWEGKKSHQFSVERYVKPEAEREAGADASNFSSDDIPF